MIGALIGLALAILAFEAVWFSGPGREWRLARLDLAALARHVAAQPYDTRGLHAYARALSAAGREEEAAAALHRAVVMDPGSPSLLLAMGEAMRRLRRWERAEQYLGEAIRRGERSPDAKAALAAVYQEQGRFPDAAVLWREVTTARPKDAAAWHALGLCEAQMLRPKEWEDAMSRAARLAPENGEHHRALGEALAYQEAWPAAEAAFFRALSLRPDDARARYQWAAIRSRQADTPDAVAAVLADFRRAADALPADPEPRLAMGRFLAEQGRWTEAARAFADALRLDPTHESAHYHHATALRRAGRHADAEAALSRFRHVSDAQRAVRYLEGRLELAPNDSDLKRRLSRAHERLRALNHEDTKETQRARRKARNLPQLNTDEHR